MATYLIDYENVHQNGVAGIDKLPEDDTVLIFVGKKTSDIPVDTVDAMLQSSAQIKIIKMRKTADNYLDFQLATCLGGLIYEAKDADFFIISSDKGFQSVIDYWKSSKASVRILQRPAIQGDADSDPEHDPQRQAPPNGKSPAHDPQRQAPSNGKSPASASKQLEPPKGIRNRIKPIITKEMSLKRLSGAAHRKTYDIFHNAKKATSNKAHSLQDRLRNEFGTEEGTFLYNELKGIFDEYAEAK